MTLTNQFSVFENLCNSCNQFQCSCQCESIDISLLTFEECEVTNFEMNKTSEHIIFMNTSSILSQESKQEFERLSIMNNGHNSFDSNSKSLNGGQISKCSELLVSVHNENEEHHGISKNQLIPKVFDSLPNDICSKKTLTNRNNFKVTQLTNNNLNLSKSKDPLSLKLKKKGYNIGHLNIQGLCGDSLNKFSEISILLTNKENENLHIFGMSESKLKQHKLTGTFKINGFQTPFRKDNVSNGGGGIIVYVRDHINAKRREDLETNDISCLWLEISPENGKSFLVGNMYRPPDSKIEYNDRFEDFIDTILNEEKEFILMGDINKNLLNNDIEREWGNFITSLGLTQLVSEPTRVTDESSTLIDHIYTNNEYNIQNVNVEKLCFSDHYGIFCNRSSHVSYDRKNEHQYITYRSFRNFEEPRFLNDLALVPWEIIECFDTVDDMVTVWTSLFTEVLNKHAPIKNHRVKHKYQPDWLTPEILDLIKERNKYKLNGNTTDYKVLRNKVSELIKNAKKETYKSKIEEGKSDPRNIWKIFKEFGMNSKGSENKSNVSLKLDDKFVTNESELTEIFNDYFVNIASTLKQPTIETDFEKLHNYVSTKVPCDTEFKIPLTNQAFIKTFLSNLNVNKSTGLDTIGPKILKMSANVITPSILFIVNKSISLNQFPNIWKEAKVKPLFKSGSKDDINNYRPISILPTISKLIEKWVEKQFSQ